MSYDFDFSVFLPYTAAFIRGVGTTVLLAFWSSLLGTVFGFLLGLTLRIRELAWFLIPLNDAIRAVPILVLMFFFYYFPYHDVLRIEAPSAFFVSVVALTIAQTVFTADLVRAAVDGVSENSVLGAEALGLSPFDVTRFIVLPDVIRQILPSMLAFYIGNLKLSSLAAVIGCPEIVFMARVAVSRTYRSIEAWLVIGMIYIVLVLPLAWAARMLERSQWLKRR